MESVTGKRIYRIGIFDSGVGGLSILNAIIDLPLDEIIYIADTAHMPYGNKSSEQIAQASCSVVEQLLTHHVDAIIIACHTAACVALAMLQQQFGTTIFFSFIEPTAQAARARSTTGRIGLLGTQATVTSNMYQKLLAPLAITAVACPELASLIEAGHTNSATLQMAVKKYTRPLIEAHVDTVILGCTHYDLIEPVLQKHLGPDRRLITAQEPTRYWLQKQIAIGEKRRPSIKLLATGPRPTAFDYFEPHGANRHITTTPSSF